MTVPAIVEERLDGETVTSRVPLGGDDQLFVTPNQTLLYRAEGLLSGESVEGYSHEAERISLNEGRRKFTITIEHGIDDQSQFSVPADRFEQAIEPILHGVLTAAGVTEPGETVQELYRLGELTLVLTDARLVKHVGEDLWDEEYEEFPFEDVTAVDLEEGSVSSQIIVEVDGRPQRIKTPRDDARRIQKDIKERVLAHHSVPTYDEFRRAVVAERDAVADATVADPASEPDTQSAEPDAPGAGRSATEEEPDEPAEEAGSSGMVFGEGVGTVPIEEAESDEEGDLAAELAALRSAVERQNDLLRRHQQVLDRLTREFREAREED